MNPRPALDSRLMPTFSHGGTPDIATKRMLPFLRQDPKLTQVPEVIKNLQPNLFSAIMAAGMKFPYMAALQHQGLLELAVMNLRLYASIAYMQPTMIEHMVIWYTYDVEARRLGFETLALRQDLDPTDPDVLRYISVKKASMVQLLECISAKVATPGQSRWDVTSTLLTSSLFNRVALSYTRIESKPVQLQHDMRSDVGARRSNPAVPWPYESILAFVPLINQAELEQDDVMSASLPTAPALPMVGMPNLMATPPAQPAPQQPAVQHPTVPSPMLSLMLPAGSRVPLAESTAPSPAPAPAPTAAPIEAGPKLAADNGPGEPPELPNLFASLGTSADAPATPQG